jgi:hypothetical protein
MDFKDSLAYRGIKVYKVITELMEIKEMME